MIDSDEAMKSALNGVGLVFTEHPPDIASRLPCVVVVDVGGGEPSPGFDERPGYVIEAWATSNREARVLSAAARDALHHAWKHRTPLPGCYINTVRTDARPTRVDSGLDNVYRVAGTYTIHLRPR